MRAALLMSLWMLPSLAFADQCPQLAGLYHCPAVHGNPGYEMQVTQVGSVRKKVSYSWRYGPSPALVGFVASVKGARNPNGYYGVCRNKGLYVTLNREDLSGSDRHEVNPMGNYVVTTFMGEPVLTCIHVR